MIKSELTLSEHNRISLIRLTAEYAKAAQAANTVHTYDSLTKSFKAWCNANNVMHMPASAEAVALYITSLARTHSRSTIDVAISAIEDYHRRHKRVISGDLNLYKDVRRGIRRLNKDKAVVTQAKALTMLDIATLRLLDPFKTMDVRDKAIILLLFFGALRRSELAALTVECVTVTHEGMQLVLLQSKTTDAPQTVTIGRAKDIEICPVVALERWLDISGITSGHLMASVNKAGVICSKSLSGQAIGDVMKKHFGDGYSGHSGRRGLMTEEAKARVNIYQMAKHARHSEINTTARYVEEEQAFETSSTKLLGV
jgi:integrase